MKNSICLMYHDVFVHDTNESGFLRERDIPYKLKVENFEQQVKAIYEFCKSKRYGSDHVIFTFDDGGKSFINVIAPILEKYGYRGVFFISSKYIGDETFLSEKDILDLYERGHIIGSHAHTHEHLYTLSDDDVEKEWRESVRILNRIIGEPILYASIPNGDTSQRVLCSVVNNGIKHIYTSEPTTKKRFYNGTEIIGRYVVLADNSTNYVLSIIKNPCKRFVLSCKRVVLGIIKKILGAYYIELKNRLYK